MSTEKTLADAQPGGRVRLPDRTERARFEDWYVQNAFDYVANPLGSRDCALQWKGWQAALSAQPSPGETLPPDMRLGSPDYLDYLDTESSPGGQGAREQFSEWWSQQSCAIGTLLPYEIARLGWNGALAARQPVGEPVAWKYRAPGVSFWRVSFRKPVNPEWECEPLYAAPPAQAVDLGEMPEGWRLSKKATCYQLSHGNDIIGNLVGPDAEGNAEIIARVLNSQAVGK